MTTEELHALVQEAAQFYFHGDCETFEQACLSALAKLQEKHEADLKDWYQCEICSRDMTKSTPDGVRQVPVCIPCWNEAHKRHEADRDAAVAEALEKAAQACLEEGNKHNSTLDGAFCYNEAEDCAAAIRSLKGLQ